MAAETVIVDIYISPEEFLQHYQGSVKQVSCIARDGRRVRFPSKILQPFVTHDGIQGAFVILFDANHRFVSIHRES